MRFYRNKATYHKKANQMNLKNCLEKTLQDKKILAKMVQKLRFPNWKREIPFITRSRNPLSRYADVLEMGGVSAVELDPLAYDMGFSINKNYRGEKYIDVGGKYKLVYVEKPKPDWVRAELGRMGLKDITELKAELL